MTTTREKIAGQAQIGNVSFWATRATPQPTPRRIVQYTGVGITGAQTEDLGQDARTETLTATVDELVYLDLDQIKKEANVVTIVHPLFGVFQGRVLDVTAEATPDPMVDITVTVVEHGDPADLFAPIRASTASLSNSASAAYADMSGDLDDLDDFPTDTGLPSANQNFQGAYNNFTAVADSVNSADAVWTEAAAAYNELATATNVLIDTIDDYAAATQEMVSIVDSAYELIDVTRTWVDTMANQAESVWQDFRVLHPLSLAEIALDIMGDASEETIDLLLERNPTLIDVTAVPIGVNLSVPVVL
jgi:hypothetical protein